MLPYPHGSESKGSGSHAQSSFFFFLVLFLPLFILHCPVKQKFSRYWPNSTYLCYERRGKQTVLTRMTMEQSCKKSCCNVFIFLHLLSFTSHSFYILCEILGAALLCWLFLFGLYRVRMLENSPN